MSNSYPSEIINGQTVYKVPLSKVYQALVEENGHVELIRGEWFTVESSPRFDSGIVVGACILGQASINMGVKDQNNFKDTPIKFGVSTTLVDQLNRFSIDSMSKWALIDTDGKLGDTIIAWNDKEGEHCISTEHGPKKNLSHDQVDLNNLFNYDNEEYDKWEMRQMEIDREYDKCFKGYALPTYSDVLKMAHDILEPHFSETVYLASKEWATA